jgi:hypothetical protein
MEERDAAEGQLNVARGLLAKEESANKRVWTGIYGVCVVVAILAGSAFLSKRNSVRTESSSYLAQAEKNSPVSGNLDRGYQDQGARKKFPVFDPQVTERLIKPGEESHHD